MNKHILSTIITGILMGTSAASIAETSATDLARLGKDLTPVGAEQAGNKDGSIPEWKGGLTKPPANFDPKKGYANPFADEKPLVVITAANYKEYEQLLPPGNIAMLKQYPDYKMKVYSSHRTVGQPQSYYDSALRYAPKAKLAEGGHGVANVDHAPALPFPVPKSGAEIIANHMLRYKHDAARLNMAIAAPQTNGSFTPVRWDYDVTYTAKMADAEPNRIFYFREFTLSPSNSAGEATLVHDLIDFSTDVRKAWTYNPGQRRVLRAPDVAYDFPYFNVDGLATVDQQDQYNGSYDRYDWKLLGKKEMLISYNNYDLTSKALKYSDILKPGHINQDLPRYEKHRVWVVEGTVKAGARHIYQKRVFFVDEDSWAIVHADLYDARGNLWRVQEGHAMQFYDVPGPWYAMEAVYDLQSGRYMTDFMTNEEKPAGFNKLRKLSDYSTEALRNSGK